jgi:hypothetical protein
MHKKIYTHGHKAASTWITNACMFLDRGSCLATALYAIQYIKFYVFKQKTRSKKLWAEW